MHKTRLKLFAAVAGALPLLVGAPAALAQGAAKACVPIPVDKIGIQLYSLNAVFAGTTTEMPWAPATDVSETDDAYVIEAELPGLKKDEIDVSLHDRELAITGEVKERESRGLRHRKQRRSGRFECRVYLPGDIDSERVGANLSDGVLTVTLPPVSWSALALA